MGDANTNTIANANTTSSSSKSIMSAPTPISSTRSIASTSSSFVRKKSIRNKDEVRSRLLNNLGIFHKPNNGSKPPVDDAPNPAIARKINILRAMGLGGVIPPSTNGNKSSNGNLPGTDRGEVRKLVSTNVTSEPLKYKPESTPSSGDNSSPNERSYMNRRKICFDDSVEVVPIPMRSEYSDRVRSRLWSNRYEIHENATRNAIEFAAEGWDWRSVTEDEGMFVCTASGELIHPVHCQQ